MKNSVHKKKFQKVALGKYQITYVVSFRQIGFRFYFFLFLRTVLKRFIKAELRLHILDRRSLQIFLSCTDPNMNLVFFLQISRLLRCRFKALLSKLQDSSSLYSQISRTGCVTKSFSRSLTLSYSRSVISHCQQALS